MKFLRSLLDVLDFGKKSAEPEAVPKKKEAPRPYRSPFRPGAGGDGFEAGARKPVDLSGGVKVHFAEIEESVDEPPPEPESDFAASLDDLGTLLEEAQAQAAAEPDQSSFAADPLDVFEPAPSFEPVDSFEPAESTEMSVHPERSRGTELPVAAAEAPVVVAGVPVLVPEPPFVEVTAEPVTPPDQPVAVEPPVAAPVAAPPAPVASQYTVELLMRLNQERPARAEAPSQFSTLDLLDTVEQLKGPEEAAPTEQAAQAPEATPKEEAPKPEVDVAIVPPPES